ncbi:MAG: hypothetical protein II025_05895, partial [Ruminococcus sp.]|nr:hypothetical protein [Ruminococcus sp.]
KRIAVTDTGYRLYSRIWVWSYPVRFLYKKCRSALGALVKKITKNMLVSVGFCDTIEIARSH